MANSPDKEKLYGKWQAGEDRRQHLAFRAAHKALDIADDDMNISATTNHNHSPAKSNVLPWVIAAAVLAFVGGQALTKALTDKPAAVTTPAAPTLVQDVEQLQDPATGQWRELWRGPARPKQPGDKVQTP